MTPDSIHTKLLAVQAELKAPKGQTNAFGKYKYRSCEDILEAVKPLLKDNGLVLTLSDEIVNIGVRFYVKATAAVFFREAEGEFDHISVTAYAREEEDKKGMDHAQITGSASSYARKYALNGLFCIDDTKDSDATNTHDDKPAKATPKTAAEAAQKSKPTVTVVMEHLSGADSREKLDQAWTRANAYTWTADEHKTLHECYQNNLKKFPVP